ncbi:MAG: TIR domain-containing protein [Pseudomonadota bacterium]
MADVFLSYSREDQGIARRFADGLAQEGFSVWWDQSLRAGEDFDRVTERALSEARAVVVLWSRRSVDSRWVRAEATEAKSNNRLVPAMIEACKRPILFELTHTADLVDWKGDTQDPRWRSFVDGLRRLTGSAEAAQASGFAAVVPAGATTVAAQRRPWLLAAISTAAVLVAGGAWYLHGRGLTSSKPAAESAEVAGGTEASIAVLPFVNMSADPEQEYFSDGLSEELINQLAHIDGLRVTARTSAFSFKGKAQDLRTVGQALGVAHILEGSVRKSGGNIRVTVQLINTATGYHVWSETFDRAVNDVFAIQDEIASAVASKLGPSLGIVPRTTDFGGTRNPEAYDHFLRGIAQFAKSVPKALEAAIQEYRRALAIDPDFARAYAELVITMGGLNIRPDDTAAQREREEAVRKALQIAPDAPLTQVASMWYHSERHEWVEADAACAKVFAARSDPRAEGICGGFLTLTGRVRAALPYREAFRSSDPLSVPAAASLTRHYAMLGMEPDMRREFSRAEGFDAGRQAVETVLAHLANTRGQQAELESLLTRYCSAMGPNRCEAWTAAISNPQEASPRLRAQLRAISESSPNSAGSIALAAAYVGDTSLALDALQVFTSKGNSALFQTLWLPLLGEVRKGAGFKRNMEQLGFVDLWRRTGRWADACRPTGNDDFECS